MPRSFQSRIFNDRMSTSQRSASHLSSYLAIIKVNPCPSSAPCNQGKLNLSSDILSLSLSLVPRPFGIILPGPLSNIPAISTLISLFNFNLKRGDGICYLDKIVFCDPVVSESICYRTRAKRLINEDNTIGGLRKIWTGCCSSQRIE